MAEAQGRGQQITCGIEGDKRQQAGNLGQALGSFLIYRTQPRSEYWKHKYAPPSSSCQPTQHSSTNYI